jgi:hypothetical protein
MQFEYTKVSSTLCKYKILNKITRFASSAPISETAATVSAIKQEHCLFNSFNREMSKDER